MKSFLILLIMIILTSCVSGTAPSMTRKVKIWNGAPEEIGICRISTDTLAQRTDGLKIILKTFHQGTKAHTCINAQDAEFQKYGCLTFDDIGVLYEYIKKLNFQCEKWKQ